MSNTNDPIASIREHVEDLSVAVAHWASRDDTKDRAAARRAASTAVDAIDALLRELHQVRSRTITEARRWDDARNAELDAYLARRSR